MYLIVQCCRKYKRKSEAEKPTGDNQKKSFGTSITEQFEKLKWKSKQETFESTATSAQSSATNFDTVNLETTVTIDKKPKKLKKSKSSKAEKTREYTETVDLSKKAKKSKAENSTQDNKKSSKAEKTREFTETADLSKKPKNNKKNKYKTQEYTTVSLEQESKKLTPSKKERKSAKKSKKSDKKESRKSNKKHRH